MSVKNKIKRLNKEIDKLKMIIASINRENYKKEEENKKEQIHKDNFIKLMLNMKKPIEHRFCMMTVDRKTLDSVRNADLDLEEDIYTDSVKFRLKM